MGRHFTIAICACALFVSALASAQQSVPPDVVRLRDGTFLRGTIVEQSPTTLVLLLPTGETRTYAASEVESAGPQQPLSQNVAPPVIVMPPGPPVAHLQVRSEQSNLSLQRLQGTATINVSTYSARGGVAYGTAQVDQFGIICNAPCETEIPQGTYQLGVAQGTGSAVRAGLPIDLRGNMELDLHYIDQSSLRIAGWVTFGVGIAAACALILAWPFAGGLDNDDFSLVIAGGVVFGVTLIPFWILAFQNDGATIESAAEGVRF